MIVVDASLTLAAFFHDERTPAVVAAFNSIADVGAVVPAIWRLEVANGLQMSIRRNLIDTPFRDAALERLAALPISIDTETNDHAWSATLRLAEEHGLTPYDAAYLELALRRSLPLATQDSAMTVAMAKADVSAPTLATGT